jgi:hypothetical protein
MSDAPDMTKVGSGTPPKRTPAEQQFLSGMAQSRRLEGLPPMTVEQENLALSQAGTLGMVETNQPTGQAFMAPRRPSPKVEPPNPEPTP